MDLLLVLKEKNNFLGYNGKGDFSLENKNEKISRLLKTTRNNYVFTGLQIINPNILDDSKKNFPLEKFFWDQL